MAVFGHSGSQAPQLMHSLVITVAIEWPSFELAASVRWRAPRALGPPPPAREPALGELEFAVAEQHEAPPALDRRPPAARADRIRDQRAQHAAGGARDRDAREPQLAPVHEVARERHDDLRRERDARALDRHEEDDAGVAPGRDHADDEGGGGRQQAPEHGAPVYQLRAAEAR